MNSNRESKEQLLSAQYNDNAYTYKYTRIHIHMCDFYMHTYSDAYSLLHLNTRWNDKIVVLKKTTLQLYFKTFIEKINSGNLIM